MTILAIDTSSDRLAIGLANSEGSIGELNGAGDRRHSELILKAIDSVLRDAKLTPAQIGYLAVLTGPGSFTGLRVGIATALGLGRAWDKRVLAVGNVDLARLHWSHLDDEPVMVIHCRGDEFYVSRRGVEIEIMKFSDIVARESRRLFVGPGCERLAQLADREETKLSFSDSAVWSGGDMAQLIARHRIRFEPLDPVNLDVDRLLRAAPEYKRDTTATVVTDLALGHMDDVLEIERSAFADPWERENFAADIANPNIVTLAAVRGGRCIGYLICIALDDYGYIANIAVAAAQRSQGIGQRLLDELSQRLQQRRIRAMALDVRVSNEKAIRFYERYGFATLTRRAGFYTKPPEDSLTMVHNLEK